MVCSSQLLSMMPNGQQSESLAKSITSLCNIEHSHKWYLIDPNEMNEQIQYQLTTNTDACWCHGATGILSTSHMYLVRG